MRAHHLSLVRTSSKTQLQTTGQMHEVKPREFVLRMSGCYFSLQHNLLRLKASLAQHSNDLSIVYRLLTACSKVVGTWLASVQGCRVNICYLWVSWGKERVFRAPRHGALRSVCHLAQQLVFKGQFFFKVFASCCTAFETRPWDCAALTLPFREMRMGSPGSAMQVHENVESQWTGFYQSQIPLI